MATLNLDLKVIHTPGKAGQPPTSVPRQDITVTLAAEAASAFVQTIGLTSEAIDIPADITTPSYVFIKNLDTTNFITVGTDTAKPVKLKAGEISLFRLNPGTTFHAQADTAAVDVYVSVWSD